MEAREAGTRHCQATQGHVKDPKWGARDHLPTNVGPAHSAAAVHGGSTWPPSPMPRLPPQRQPYRVGKLLGAHRWRAHGQVRHAILVEVQHGQG